METISVIVPVYKVEQYLDKCVQSIVDQTYRNLEIILVDDGSPDRCGAICDAWAEKDSRIQVIHKPNGGLSDARNAGMNVARGQYIGFVDSDDWIEPEMYELLLSHMQEDEADISACGVIMDWEDGTPSRMLTGDAEGVFTQEEGMCAIIEESVLKQPVWYKLYKKELIQDIPFAVGKYHEDVFWSYQAVGSGQRISVSAAPCYHYLQRTGSIMSTSFSLKRLDALEAKSIRQAYVEQNFPNLTGTALRDLWFTCLYQGQQSLLRLAPDDSAKALECIRSYLKRHPISLTQKSNFSAKEQIWLQLAKWNLNSACRIRNRLKVGQ